MINKKGIALLFGMLVIMVLFILYGAFFSKTINETTQAKRYVYSTKAFWAAEAGIADRITNLSDSSVPPAVDGVSYSVPAATLRTSYVGVDGKVHNYYDIVSTGTVTFPDGATIRRKIAVVVLEKTGVADPSKFKYGIQAENDLCFGGASCNKDPADFLDPDNCNGILCAQDSCSDPLHVPPCGVNFSDMFLYSKEEVSAIATHYTEDTFPGYLPKGVYWVDVTPGSYLTIAGTDTGEGILIINGDVHVEGSYVFNGIMFVMGSLRARGTYTGTGSTIVESAVGIDSINGTPTFNYDPDAISNALSALEDSLTHKTILSWNELEAE